MATGLTSVPNKLTYGASGGCCLALELVLLPHLCGGVSKLGISCFGIKNFNTGLLEVSNATVSETVSIGGAVFLIMIGSENAGSRKPLSELQTIRDSAFCVVAL